MIYSNAAVHPFGAMVADSHDRAIRRQRRDDLAKPGIKPDVIVTNGDQRIVFGRCNGSWKRQKPWWMRSVAISTYMKKSHGFVVLQVPDDLQVLFGDVIDAAQQGGLVFGAEVRDIHPVVADRALDLQASAPAAMCIDVGVGVKAGNEMPINRPDGIGLRHAWRCISGPRGRAPPRLGRPEYQRRHWRCGR